MESGYQPNTSRLFKSIVWIIRVPVLGAMALMFVFGIINAFSNPAKMIAYRNKFRGGYELSSLEINGKLASPAEGDLLHYKKIYLGGKAAGTRYLPMEKDVAPKAIAIQRNAGNDSVITCLKKVNDVTSDEIDTTTLFKGIYKPMGDTLVIDGTLYGAKLHAVYKKLPLKDCNWFWQ